MERRERSRPGQRLTPRRLSCPCARLTEAGAWDGDRTPEDGDLCQLPQVKVWGELKLTELLRVKMAFWGQTIGSEPLAVGQEARCPPACLRGCGLRLSVAPAEQVVFSPCHCCHTCAASLSRIIRAPLSPQPFMPRPPPLSRAGELARRVGEAPALDPRQAEATASLLNHETCRAEGVVQRGLALARKERP